MEKTGKQLGRWVVTSALIVAGFFLPACKTDNAPAKFAEVPSGSRLGTTNLPPTSTPGVANPGRAPTLKEIERGGGFETIGVGDALMVVFADIPVPIPPIEEHVSETGMITLLHNESFQAAGKKRRDLEKEIHDRYVPDYYRFITVNVKLLNRFYFVEGEVKAANRYIYEGNMTVLKAITSAGGFTEFANKKNIKVIRSNKRTESENGVKALDDPSKDLDIFPGDTVHVKRKIF